jgi:glycosyltransferase involved in cell wall biosynthesis
MNGGVLTTVPPDLPGLLGAFERYDAASVTTVDRHYFTFPRLAARIVSDSQSRSAILLNGSGRGDQIIAGLVQRRRRPPPLIISECTWRAGVGAVDRFLCRVGFNLLDGENVIYCVLSSVERELFPATWRVDPDRVVFTPYCHTLSAADFELAAGPGEGIFAGGDSMRDYQPLLAAVTRIRSKLRLAVRHVPTDFDRRYVEASTVNRTDFLSLMASARVVVVPLSAGIERSAGQQTYLNAMALGKIVIVTDSPGARDYVVDGETGFIVPPADTDALEAALLHVLDPANTDQINQIIARGQEIARTVFSPQAYMERLVQLARDHAR